MVSAQRKGVVWSIVSRCVRGRMCTGAGADVEQLGGAEFFESCMRGLGGGRGWLSWIRC